MKPFVSDNYLKMLIALVVVSWSLLAIVPLVAG